jgi:phosphoribosylformylglycinamidine (FGAM) synthase-like enzyme
MPQRGDAEMAQKLWRVVRSCVELGMRNPIQQIHDQGAGGNCNVVKEIIYPLGAEINVRKVQRQPLPASASAAAQFLGSRENPAHNLGICH